VSPNTLIQASWANNTLNDVAAEITNSLARNGAGGMTGPFRATDGTVGTPSISFNSETASGVYRPAAGQIAVSIQGVLRATFSATGLSVVGDVSATGAFSGSGANLTSLNASNLASGTVPDARFPATLPAISGANLTNLNASNLASGTVPDARFPSVLPAVNGANLTNLNASNLASGTVPTARLGSGTPTSSKFLRGDGSWQGGVLGDYFYVEKDSNSGIEIRTPNQAADQKKWFIITFGGTLSINAYNDSVNASQQALAFTRSGYIVTGFYLKVDDTSVISANSNRQVTIDAPASGTHTINGGFTSGGSILVNSTTGLPATVTSNNVAFASGYSSPVSSRILFGDGTGWKLQFGRRLSGTETVIAELVDNGDINILHTSGVNSSWKVASGQLYFGGLTNAQFNLTQNGQNRISFQTDGKSYVSVDSMTNEIGFRKVPRTTDTTLNTAKVAQCIAVTAGVTIPASVYSAGDSFSIYNDSASSITLTQGSGLTLRQSGTANTGNRTLAARGMATIWFNSATEAIVMGDVT
jgi:hypothetical protein